MRKKWIALTALAIVAAGGFAAMRYGDELRAALPGSSAPEQSAAAASGAASGGGEGKEGRGGGRAAPVEVAEATAQTLRNELGSVGTLSSDESVNIAAEVAGRISEILFREGEPVAAGAVMIKLDEALARAELADAEAGLRLAEQNFERASSLSQSGAGTQRARDEAQAALATARAGIELAKVRLDKTRIRAPFDGIAGLRQASVGAYVQVGQAIVNLEKIDVIKLDFRLPEIQLSSVSEGQAVEIAVDAFPGRTFSGEVYAIDPLIDVNGRAIRVRARIENPEGLLRPGLFARVTVRGESRDAVVMVPESALVPRGETTIVYAVENGRAQEREVKIGRRTLGRVEIVEGIDARTMIVVAGQSRLRNGSPVEVVTAAAVTPRS